MFLFKFLFKCEKAVKTLPKQIESKLILNNIFVALLLFLVISISWFCIDYFLQVNRWSNRDPESFNWFAEGIINRSERKLSLKLRITFFVILGYYVSSVFLKNVIQTISGIKVPFREIALFNFCTIPFAGLLVLGSDSPFIDWNPYTERYDQHFAHIFFFLPSVLYVSHAIRIRYNLHRGKSYIALITTLLLTILIAALLLGLKNAFVEQPTFREFMNNQ